MKAKLPGNCPCEKYSEGKEQGLECRFHNHSCNPNKLKPSILEGIWDHKVALNSKIFKGGFPVLCTCYSPYIKKRVSDNAHKNLAPHFEPVFFHNFPTRSQSVESLGKLTTSLLHDIYLRTGNGYNIVLSPVSVWSILAMLLEGASGMTENELKTKLQLFYNGHEEGKHIMRNIYKELLNSYQAKNGPAEFASLNFVITDKTKAINPEYKSIIRKFYNGQHFEVDSGNSEKFSKMINLWASQVTNKRIQTPISPDMLNNLLMVIGNAVYFKSKWKYPFDPSQTVLMPFKDEYERPFGSVLMMNQAVTLPYAYNAQLQSEIVEIPYADNVTSMIVILPQEGTSIRSVLSRMRFLSLDDIIPKNTIEESIQLSIPRFHIISKIYLNEVLKKDLRSTFSAQYAEFPKIGKNIFVSRVCHKAEIENTEEGTTASAVSSVQFAYKSSSVVFQANRPFIYLINEMKTRNVLFAGTYSNPFNPNRFRN